MKLTFGATFNKVYPWSPKVPGSKNWRDGQRKVTEFMEDPILAHVLKHTSDDIAFTFDAKDSDNDNARINRISVEIKRPKGKKLPDSLRNYQSATTLFKFKPEKILDPAKAREMQRKIAEEAIDLSAQLESFDAEQVKTEAEIRKKKLAKGEIGFAQVAGMQDLKDELRESILEPLKSPKEFKKYGLNANTGILFFGPPGCGKTYIAERLAEEADLPFLKMDMGRDVGSKWIHETANKMAEFMKDARAKAPCIVFLDEAEGILADRNRVGEDGGGDGRREEVGQMLREIEESLKAGVIIIGATNMPDRIDPAARRSGRLDKVIYIPPPDEESRAASMQLFMKGRKSDKQIDYQRVAQVTKGYSQTDLSVLVDEAARLARRDKKPIGTEHLLRAASFVPASVTPFDEERYKSVQTRGTRTNQVKSTDMLARTGQYL